jgi:acyl-CoA oxidase
LTDFRDQFADARFFTLVRHLSRQAARQVSETNLVVSRKTDVAHLRSREFQLGALGYREDRLLNGVAGRLRARIEGGMDSFDATTEVQDHLLALANAHVERLVAESFADAVDALPAGPEREVLATLRDLYALSRIHHDRGWFLVHDVIAASKSRAIRDLVTRLCGELRPHAVALVDAFAVPDACLAPIAFQLGDRPSLFAEPADPSA